MTGMQLAQMGRFAEALPYLENANCATPTDIPLLHAVASVLHSSGRSADAAERYRISAAVLPENIEVLSGWARSLLLSGERMQAVSLLERALTLDSQFADADGLLTTLLWEAGEPDVACSILQPLVDRNPTHAKLLYQYAQALFAAEHLELAQAAYEHYRTLQPRDPLACVELGRLAASRGESERALEQYHAALRIDPENAPALWGIAQIEGKRLDTQTVDLIRRLAQTGQDPRNSALLAGVLARHDDRIGDFSSAATHTARMNALHAQLVPTRNRYSTAQHELEVDVAIRNWTPRLFDRLRAAGSKERRPVFIIGLPRSGTTLLERMLASHPSIIGVGEQSIARASLQRALIESGGLIEMLTPVAVGQAAGWHLQMLEDRVRRLSLRRDAERIVDKLPDNYLLAGWLCIAFPNASIIHCLRDPRDVAVSCWRTHFTKIQWAYELDHIIHRIEQHRRLMRHWRATLGSHLIQVRYEWLVADPETELRRALASIEMDWHPGMLGFAERKGFVGSASQMQVREPLHARGVGHWRHYEEVLQPILPRLNAIAAKDALDVDSAAAH